MRTTKGEHPTKEIYTYYAMNRQNTQHIYIRGIEDIRFIENLKKRKEAIGQGISLS